MSKVLTWLEVLLPLLAGTKTSCISWYSGCRQAVLDDVVAICAPFMVHRATTRYVIRSGCHLGAHALHILVNDNLAFLQRVSVVPAPPPLLA